jgi:hypothetical protein
VRKKKKKLVRLLRGYRTRRLLLPQEQRNREEVGLWQPLWRRHASCQTLCPKQRGKSPWASSFLLTVPLIG